MKKPIFSTKAESTQSTSTPFIQKLFQKTGWRIAACFIPLTMSACASQSSKAGFAETQRASQTATPTAPIQLALKYVSYMNDSGESVINQAEAEKVVNDMNRLYADCGIGFRLEEFVSVRPKDMGLEFNPDSMGDLNPIREVFDENGKLTIINTGTWDSSGGLGADGANAWTVLPGQAPAGAVIEGTVSDTSNLIAHEMGHYLGLDHVSDSSNIMNPVIYSDSSAFSPGQCESMKDSAKSTWMSANRA